MKKGAIHIPNAEKLGPLIYLPSWKKRLFGPHIRTTPYIGRYSPHPHPPPHPHPRELISHAQMTSHKSSQICRIKTAHFSLMFWKLAVEGLLCCCRFKNVFVDQFILYRQVTQSCFINFQRFLPRSHWADWSQIACWDHETRGPKCIETVGSHGLHAHKWLKPLKCSFSEPKCRYHWTLIRVYSIGNPCYCSNDDLWLTFNLYIHRSILFSYGY